MNNSYENLLMLNSHLDYTAPFHSDPPGLYQIKPSLNKIYTTFPNNSPSLFYIKPTDTYNDSFPIKSSKSTKPKPVKQFVSPRAKPSLNW
jgi:hypothetical protein